MNFEELNLAAAIVKAVREHGYETPTAIQAQAIPLILEGRDLLGGAQTGPELHPGEALRGAEATGERPPDGGALEGHVLIGHRDPGGGDQDAGLQRGPGLGCYRSLPFGLDDALGDAADLFGGLPVKAFHSEDHSLDFG